MLPVVPVSAAAMPVTLVVISAAVGVLLDVAVFRNVTAVAKSSPAFQGEVESG